MAGKVKYEKTAKIIANFVCLLFRRKSYSKAPEKIVCYTKQFFLLEAKKRNLIKRYIMKINSFIVRILK